MTTTNPDHHLPTAFTTVFGVRHPLVQAGMSGHANAELVAAVAAAGGLGLLGSVFMDPAEVARRIATVRALLADTPVARFGLQVVLAEPHAALLELVIAERLPVLATSWGDPAAAVAQVRAQHPSVRVLHQVTTVAEAQAVVALPPTQRPDALIAQGSEGGGHSGTVGTLALLPAVVDVAAPVGLPVLAAGGIADGRGLAAVLLLGAAGAVLGTRFLAASECGILPAWQAALLAAQPEDAWATPLPDLPRAGWPGATARVLANPLLRTWQPQAAALVLAPDNPTLAAMRAAVEHGETTHDADAQFLYAGQSTGVIHTIQPAAEIITTLVRDARLLLRGASARW